MKCVNPFAALHPFDAALATALTDHGTPTFEVSREFFDLLRRRQSERWKAWFWGVRPEERVGPEPEACHPFHRRSAYLFRDALLIVTDGVDTFRRV